mmetsp:Transcript_10788/g.23893  ORF Transcript_10788/g.23893 Transcript_10788/m.23893 type:complete len:347 (-) Transcript_10788:124-1164(-)|eukprot:CAMPEP_0172321404 /NCGR_PEP_ID=MMETSP1058-20130122/43275_1 /TAXON_ID=83371 /ORGANISM="Detonula confervacea, Strain CCMP 353" /LENGTH=346 /DNA_ID=CAMNT_0013036901 /DNA_START=10 /DNA_END=1050 /DNA_ORIENTATION=-
MDQVTVILPGANATFTDANNSQKYPINALRQSSSYFDAMLGGRWLETQHDTEIQNSDGNSVSPVVDLSQSGLDPVACTSVLGFMVSRYSSANDGDKYDIIISCNDATSVDANKGEEMKHKEVTLIEMKAILFKGFQWDEEESTIDWGASFHGVQNNDQQFSSSHSPPSDAHSDEVILYQVIDYLHLQPHDEIMSKLWAMKIVHCPIFLEDALKKQDFIESTVEGVEMFIKKIPERSQRKERMWRFLVCMFICRMLVYSEDGKVGAAKCYDEDMTVDQIRAINYQRRLDTCDAMNQLSYLCLGIGEQPAALLIEMVDCGLLKREEDMSAYRQTSLDSQVMILWDFLV